MAAYTPLYCNRVYLPDLISHQKELAVRRELKIDHHPIQRVFCQAQNKRRTASSSLKKAVAEHSPATQSQQQKGPSGVWLRYYHVFKEGKLAQLTEHRILELYITHSYFDHANWCVIAEKAEVWKI